MLSDDELEALRGIERRLRWESPELARLFSSVGAPPAKSRRTRARARVLVAAAAFAGLALLGPRMLSEAEIKTQKNPPLPRTSPPVTTAARPKGPVAGPAAAITPAVAVVDLFLGPSPTAATPSCQGRREAHVASGSLDRRPQHVHAVSREA